MTLHGIPFDAPLQGMKIEALLPLSRLDRLRVLLGAKWCDCGCGLVQAMSYRAISDLCKLPHGTLQKLTGTGRVYIATDRLEALEGMSHLPKRTVLSILNVLETPTKERHG